MLLGWQVTEQGRGPLAEQDGVGAPMTATPRVPPSSRVAALTVDPTPALAAVTTPAIALAAGGRPPLTAGSLDSYVRGWFYPAGLEVLVQGFVGALVVLLLLPLASRCANGRRRRASVGAGRGR
jgi:hypothetical protein